jgi:hypothetical protein
MRRIMIVIAIGLGTLIAYVDSRPNWDDTGITAAAVLASSFLCAAVDPTMPWLWALCVGIWIPLEGIVLTQNFGSLLALVFAFAGAYTGMAARKVMSPQAQKSDR